MKPPHSRSSQIPGGSRTCRWKLASAWMCLRIRRTWKIQAFYFLFVCYPFVILECFSQTPPILSENFVEFRVPIVRLTLGVSVRVRIKCATYPVIRVKMWVQSIDRIVNCNLEEICWSAWGQDAHEWIETKRSFPSFTSSCAFCFETLMGSEAADETEIEDILLGNRGVKANARGVKMTISPVRDSDHQMRLILFNITVMQQRLV